MSLQPTLNVESNSNLLRVADPYPAQRIPARWLIPIRVAWWMITVLLAGHLLVNVQPYYLQLATLSNPSLVLSKLPLDVIRASLARLGCLTAIRIVFSLAYDAGGVLGTVAQAVHPIDPESPAAEVLVGDTALHEWAATD